MGCNCKAIMSPWKMEGLTLAEAAEKMGVSYRQAKRLRKSFEENGIVGLLHGNQGRTPANKVGDDLRLRVLALSKERYSEFNDSHFAEMLVARNSRQDPA